MNNKDIKLIALDVDGTIIDLAYGITLPEAVRDTVQEARSKGVHVCLCSARPSFMLPGIAEDIGGVDAHISVSGAIVDADGELLFEDALPKTIAEACLDTAVRLGFFATFPTHEKLYVLQRGDFEPSEQTAEALPEVVSESEMRKLIAEHDFPAAFIFTDPGVPDATVLDEPSLASACILKASDNCFVIANKGTDKGSGLLKLAAHYGVSKESILAAGNEASDIPMLRVSGIGIAVKNAAPEVLKIADYICPDAADAGVAEAIRRFVL